MNNVQFFVLRRLHSLAGVVAVGLFLIEHLFTNAFITNGPDAYNSQIAFLQKLPFLHAIEIVCIGLPLAFHAILGVVYTFTSSFNPWRLNYGSEWRYFLQRVTGIAALVFIAQHVYSMRFVNYPADHDFYRVVAEALSSPGMLAWYVIGLFSSVFHFVNGIWAALIVWGVTINTHTQRLALWACYAFGVVLFGMGMAALTSASALF